jgi:proteasome lid subunit RPN8/RPN11
MADTLSESPLRLPPALREQLNRWAADGHPYEICGLLVGAAAPDGTAVSRITRARNLAIDRSRDRYTLDPEHFLAVDSVARADGLEIVGVWHTHPDHPPRPSTTDLVAAWETFSYLILSVARDGVRDAAAWRLAANGGFVEQPILAGGPERQSARSAAGGRR